MKKNAPKPEVELVSAAFAEASEWMRSATTLFFFTFLILMGGAHAFSAHAAAAKVIGARVAGDDERTRFVFDLDSQVKPAISGLSRPFRLIIDLPEVEFQLPDGAGTRGRGMVTTWRFGLFAPGKSRVVMDLSGPVRVDKTFFLPAVDDQPARLVIDLVKSTPEDFDAFVLSSRGADK